MKDIIEILEIIQVSNLKLGISNYEIDFITDFD
jgi:hypothetical protein